MVMAVDIGTSSVRVGLFDRRGRSVIGAEQRRGYEIRTSIEGASEIDADELLENLWLCIDDVLEKSVNLSRRIAAVAACTFVGNIMGINSLGQASTPLMTYADTRAEKEVAGLKKDFDEAVVHDRTGVHFHSSYLPARFRWLARERRDLFQRVARWISIGEYMEMKLFGETAVSYSVASWSGLLDRHNLIWDPELLDMLALDWSNLSPLVDANAARAGLLSEFADRWPVLAGIPWFPALGDGATANVGSGCITRESVALTMGTTTALRVVTTEPVDTIPEGLWCYRVDRRRSLPGGALSEGGNLFGWLNHILRIEDMTYFEVSLEPKIPDCHGLTVLPFLSGERSPGWRGDARGVIHGLSQATRPEDIMQAGLEAVAFRIGMVFQRLAGLLPGDVRVVAGGGALRKSALWLQIITDVLGRPVELTSIEETSARGAALLAFEALGLIDDLKTNPVLTERTFFPDFKRHAIYRSAMERQQKLYNTLLKSD